MASNLGIPSRKVNCCTTISVWCDEPATVGIVWLEEDKLLHGKLPLQEAAGPVERNEIIGLCYSRTVGPRSAALSRSDGVSGSRKPGQSGEGERGRRGRVGVV